MIYTVTFNPALDYIVRLEKLSLGEVNRSEYEAVYYGGKGINVSTVLNNLAIPSVALGFVAGFTGKEIEDGVKKLGVQTDFIHLQDGMSRINVKIKAGEETEINGKGPHISQAELEQLYQKLDRLQKGDILVLAGTIPASLPADIYEVILGRLEKKEVEFVVDATGDLLKNVLKYHPFLIKPNNHELGELFGVTLENDQQIEQYARKLQDMGAQNVLISMAGEGAVLIAADGQCLEAPAPKGKLVNGVGAGDSMVAGFLTGWLEEKEYAHAFCMGIAAGSASAFSENLATKDEVMQVLKQVKK